MLEAGAKLPAVSAADDEGNIVKLTGLTGSPLVIYFYPRADTPGCTNEALQFRDDYKKFTKKGAQIIGVSRDSVAAQAKFKAKYELPFPLLADVDSKICDAFGVIVEKNMYGKKSMGVQRATFLIGADGKIAKVWPKVSVAGHAAEVLKSL
ncbi:MAG: peroxiredoxin [Candidatus Velthaea sp.]